MKSVITSFFVTPCSSLLLYAGEVVPRYHIYELKLLGLKLSPEDNPVRDVCSGDPVDS